jgi:hypothetical protein
MKKIFYVHLSALLLASFSSILVAQDSTYHPNLSDNFIFAAGAFRSDNAFTLSAQGVEVGSEDINFGDSIGVDKSGTIANVQLRWKYGKKRKWSIWGQYFANDATGDATLEKDVDWNDTIFREGTFVDGGVKVAVSRVFVGRSFVKNEQHDFGVGIGIHNLDISAYIGGEVLVNDGTTGYERRKSSASQILPNVGTWYNFSPAKKWLIHGRLDWISANIGDYDGTMWNTNAGINYQAWRHVGFDLSYQYFNINLNVDKGTWRGGVDMRYSGPIVSVTANW